MNGVALWKVSKNRRSGVVPVSPLWLLDLGVILEVSLKGYDLSWLDLLYFSYSTKGRIYTRLIPFKKNRAPLLVGELHLVYRLSPQKVVV